MAEGLIILQLKKKLVRMICKPQKTPNAKVFLIHRETRQSSEIIDSESRSDLALLFQAALTSGCDVNMRDASQRTALHYAAAHGKVEPHQAAFNTNHQAQVRQHRPKDWGLLTGRALMMRHLKCISRFCPKHRAMAALPNAAWQLMKCWPLWRCGLPAMGGLC